MTHAPHRSFLRRDGFFLPLHAGLFVVLAFTQLGQYTCLLTQLFETSDSAFNRFVFSDPYSRHKFAVTPNPARSIFAVTNFSSFKSRVKYFTVKMQS
jgi:hypothetical protein